MKWEYGCEMRADGQLDSLDDWSDDKEVACSIMDEEFDYLWDFKNGIHFVDRIYSDYQNGADINDEEMFTRMEKHEADMVFSSFEDVYRWILKHGYTGGYSNWIRRRVLNGCQRVGNQY